jgi:hypothetical protein
MKPSAGLSNLVRKNYIIPLTSAAGKFPATRNGESISSEKMPRKIILTF